MLLDQTRHVVHGHHDFRDGPVTIEGRTNLDTQAWYTGRLAIGVFDDEVAGGRYPFSRFMASPSRAKRSELEHDSFASTLPGSIGGEVVVANMDGPDPDSATRCFGRPLILTPAQRVSSHMSWDGCFRQTNASVTITRFSS